MGNFHHIASQMKNADLKTANDLQNALHLDAQNSTLIEKKAKLTESVTRLYLFDEDGHFHPLNDCRLELAHSFHDFLMLAFSIGGSINEDLAVLKSHLANNSLTNAQQKMITLTSLVDNYLKSTNPALHEHIAHAYGIFLSIASDLHLSRHALLRSALAFALIDSIKNPRKAKIDLLNNAITQFDNCSDIISYIEMGTTPVESEAAL